MPTGGGGGGVTSGSNTQVNSLGVGIAADGTTGNILAAGAIATGGNANTGATAGDVLIARASGGVGVLKLGGSNASPTAQVNTGTDAASNTDFQIGVAGSIVFTAGNVYCRLRSGLVFANLPTPSSNFEGALASITDSTVNTFGATIAGSGTNHVLAYCDGTHWTVAGI